MGPGCLQAAHHNVQSGTAPYLMQCVARAMDMASHLLDMLEELGPTTAADRPATHKVAVFLGEKAVAETAMLLMCVNPIKSLDADIERRFHAIARRLIPHARSPDKLSAICLDPGWARDHAFTHVLLKCVGYTDQGVDDLLAASLRMDAFFGPDRLPHRRLEQEWLARISGMGGSPPGTNAIADSMLARPVDVLGSTRMDYYAFSHAVMYATDLGGRQIDLPREGAAISADADAALAFSLDANDYDLTAELLLTWPMLDLPWTNTASFAFAVLLDVEAGLGFLPGANFNHAGYHKSVGKDRLRLAVSSSYHAAYVMGILCATVVRRCSIPSAATHDVRRAAGAAATLLRHFGAAGAPPGWRPAFDNLTEHQQDSLAPMLLAMLLQRARARYDFGLVSTALEIGLAWDCVEGPAPQQAAALLRRVALLQL
jgi:hypothetical protein